MNSGVYPDPAPGACVDSARLIAENAALAAPPDVVEITLEVEAGSQTPSGALILSWTPPTT